MSIRRHWSALVAAIVLLVGVFWLRAPSFGFNVWNVDEAIHAAAARVILDGGVLYRDTIDQRTPLSYHVVAAVFAVAGENNLWAVRALVAGLVAFTAWLLFLLGRRLGHAVAGGCAAAAYAGLATGLFFQGDANAANTEWFVATFTAAAAWMLLAGPAVPAPRRTFFAGLLLGLAFLSKQPALLDLAAPAAFFLWLAWQRQITMPNLGRQLASLAAGWMAPVALTAAWFAIRGASGDFVFYTWTYNLDYYGPEISTAGRVNALLTPFTLLAGSMGALLAAWVLGAAVTVRRLLQRVPAGDEQAANPALAYLAVWSLSSLAGSASGGRDFHHYAIQFLPALALGLGLALARAVAFAGPGRRWFVRVPAVLLLVGVAWQFAATTLAARGRTLPGDSSLRVAAYIKAHSTPQDRIFVWGFHPDIYLHADRRPASRFLYASFVTGLIPWTNTAPDQDTAYAVVPGAMETLLRDLTARRPRFVVDCSAGPNRHWQKYPLEKFPALRDHLARHYRVVEAGQFVPQGFRLFQRRDEGESALAPAVPDLPAEVSSTLALGVLGRPVLPIHASAPHGANFGMVEGRAEIFAHAPSRLTYRIPAGTTAIRGGFGLRAGAYAPENQAPSDGAEFIVRWRTSNGTERELFRRHLQPRQQAGDRGVQSLRLTLSGEPGELVLEIGPGPADNPASDWTFWSDLTLETFR